jgi:cell division protein FtsB
VLALFWAGGASLEQAALRMTPGLLLAQRILPISVLVIAGVSVPMMVFSPDGLTRLEHLNEEKQRAEDEVSRLSQQIQELRSQVQRIKEDPAMVERAARDELGLVRKTEVVFQFKD